jgi:hypothetical protein
MVVTERGRTKWSWYGKCNICLREPGEKCIDLRRAKGSLTVYKDVPHKGRVKRTDVEI